jgi:hypothetical protein
MSTVRSLLTGVLVVMCALPLKAQGAGTPVRDTLQNAALRAYLDCQESGCDRDFLVTEMKWVNWMRDRTDAEFHLLVTSQTTGSGGRQYSVVAIGQKQYAGKVDTLSYTSNPNDAQDVRRRGLLRVISQLLLPYAAKGPLGARLSVSFAAPTGHDATAAAAKDRWNFWTYSISTNGYASGEKRQTFSNLWSDLNANRTTEQWKIRLNSNLSYNSSKFSLTDGETFITIQRNYGVSALVAKSVGAHWSLGGRGSSMHSDFNNTDVATQLSAAAEWDFFPYKDFQRKRFTVLYTAGVRDTRYKEVTIYGKENETRPLHTLDATYGARQPWGSANVTLYGSQYLDGLKYYNAGISGSVDIRLGKGLSFNVDGRLSRVRDQLFLPRGDESNEEVIARQQALATNYRYFTFFGLRYQFGSIFNSVVNPRFGNISNSDDF